MARKIETASEPHKGASRSSSEWAQQIGTAWRNVVAKTIEGFVETGRMLIAAKRALKHGEFQPMIENDLPFSFDVAESLMAIARNTILSNSAHARTLPPHWTTLAELDRIPRPALRRFLADGRITPHTERREAERLREEAESEAAPKTRYATEVVVRRVPTKIPVYVPASRLRIVRDEPEGIALDDSEPTGELPESLRNLKPAPEPEPDRYAIAAAALNACAKDDQHRLVVAVFHAWVEDDQRRFLDSIGARIEVAR
jgi:hypothetical protein